MAMKKFLQYSIVLNILVLFSVSIHAQTYNHFLFNQNEWDVYADVQPLKPEHSPAFMSGPVFALTDTIIGGFTYKRTFTRSEDSVTMGNKPCFLREDTLTEKVYILSADSINERILYDFSLITDDSIYLSFRFENSANLALKSGWYHVDSTGFINTLSGIRNSWYLSNPQNASPYPNLPQLTWIEGIGSTISPVYLDEDFDFCFGFLTNPQSQYYLSLTCAFHDGSAIFHDSVWASIYTSGLFTIFGDSCIFNFGGPVSEIIGLETDIHIKPNPISDISTITISNRNIKNDKVYKLILNDITGRKLDEYFVSGKILKDGFELHRGHFDSGLFFLSIFDHDQSLAAFKIMMN
jgi:hypothetical protein